MICTIAEFTSMWKRESECTSRVLGALTDASLAQRVTAEDRSLGELAWHLVTSVSEMAGATGLQVPGPEPDSPTPAHAAVVQHAYETAAASLLSEVATRWTDASLAIEDDMYGEKWSRGFTLTVLLVHEIHHRGQMSVLMRQAGLTVPGIYGPNREETAAMRG